MTVELDADSALDKSEQRNFQSLYPTTSFTVTDEHRIKIIEDPFKRTIATRRSLQDYGTNGGT